MVDERFWDKVRKTESCWIWTGATNGETGYGKLSRRSIASYPILAHRYSWFLAHGVMPSKCVCHRCDNPICVRPEHLFIGTHHDNLDDMKNKGRSNRGSKHGMSKLTEHDVEEIRKSPKPINQLSSMYGVCRGAIEHILARRRWKHVA